MRPAEPGPFSYFIGFSLRPPGHKSLVERWAQIAIGLVLLLVVVLLLNVGGLPN